MAAQQTPLSLIPPAEQLLPIRQSFATIAVDLNRMVLNHEKNIPPCIRSLEALTSLLGVGALAMIACGAFLFARADFIGGCAALFGGILAATGAALSWRAVRAVKRTKPQFNAAEIGRLANLLKPSGGNDGWYIRFAAGTDGASVRPSDPQIRDRRPS